MGGQTCLRWVGNFAEPCHATVGASRPGGWARVAPAPGAWSGAWPAVGLGRRRAPACAGVRTRAHARARMRVRTCAQARTRAHARPVVTSCAAPRGGPGAPACAGVRTRAHARARMRARTRAQARMRAHARPVVTSCAAPRRPPLGPRPARSTRRRGPHQSSGLVANAQRARRAPSAASAERSERSERRAQRGTHTRTPTPLVQPHGPRRVCPHPWGSRRGVPPGTRTRAPGEPAQVQAGALLGSSLSGGPRCHSARSCSHSHGLDGRPPCPWALAARGVHVA